MANRINNIKIILIILIFISYFFAAARSIPREVVLTNDWLISLNTGAAGSSDSGRANNNLIPFSLGNRFGYVDSNGQFAINRSINIPGRGGIYLGENLWIEYDNEPSNLEFFNTENQLVLNIENPGAYPILLDNRIFTIGNEQNVLSEIGRDGTILWTYEFGAPLTSICVSSGLVLTGSIDGIIEILDSRGRRFFYFEPGGSLYPVILGSAFSKDGLQIGIISGIDQQRFLFLERFGDNDEYRIVYHEFIGEGFRRPVMISFIDNDQHVVFESSAGLGSYNVRTRQTQHIQLDGRIVAMDDSGEDGFFFLISSHPVYKELIGIRFSGGNFAIPFLDNGQNNRNTVFLRASFKSDDVFLRRFGAKLIAGGGSTLISFNLEEK